MKLFLVISYCCEIPHAFACLSKQPETRLLMLFVWSCLFVVSDIFIDSLPDWNVGGDEAFHLFGASCPGWVTEVRFEAAGNH